MTLEKNIRTQGDDDLSEKLAEFIDIVNKYGTRSDEAKQYVEQYHPDDELVGLAATVIYLKENSFRSDE